MAVNRKGRALSYARRELHLDCFGASLTVIADALAKCMEVPPPTNKPERWALVYRFYDADPKHHKAALKPIAPPSKPKQAARKTRQILSDAFLASYEWRQLRMVALTQRGNRCECCGASPSDGVTVLNVDHIKPRAKYPELALDLSNLQILCAPCNHGKGNWSERDWRTPRLVTDKRLA